MSSALLMPNPLRDFLQKKAVAEFSARAQWLAAGLVRDFWSDGPNNPFERLMGILHKPASASSPPSVLQPKSSRSSRRSQTPGIWQALPGEVAEKMWGEGFTTPGGSAMADMLIRPLGLDKQINVLDLSAGLGGLMLKAIYAGAIVTGLEPDAALALRGTEILHAEGKSMADVITYYDPQNFVAAKTVSKVFDCIIAREIFYSVQDKHKFFTALAASTKPQAQISFTDYIVNPEDRDRPAVAAWMKYEKGAAPLSLVETAEAWAKVGFNLRVHDDQTDYYRREVLFGLQRFARALASSGRPDAETRKTILQQLELWTYRAEATKQGLKLFRFYGTK